MLMLKEQDKWQRSLTVKETMLETRVDKAEGMNVSCFGIGLIRRLTFCGAIAKAFGRHVRLRSHNDFASTRHVLL